VQSFVSTSIAIFPKPPEELLFDSRHRTGPRLRPYSPAFPNPIRNSGQVVVYHSALDPTTKGSDQDGVGP
jgi:hypothetical protein